MKKSLAGSHISHSFWHDSIHVQEILRDTSLLLKNGEFKSIIWPSGCGKTTLLNILSGIIIPDSGTVLVNGKPVYEISKMLWTPTPSDVGVVFQDYGLFPWLTVSRNVGFGLVVSRMEKRLREKTVEDVLRRVWLWDFRDHYPHELSGGMRQRTAIARLLATDTDFLLFDEPFSALDFQTRYFMQEFLLEVWEKFGKTIIYVTHNIDEAIMLSDTIYLMSAHPGIIQEEIKIDLPRPRDTSSKKFTEYRHYISRFLEREVKKIFQEQ